MKSTLDMWPKILSSGIMVLQKYADYIENYCNGMVTMPGLSILNYPQMNEQLVAVLPE